MTSALFDRPLFLAAFVLAVPAVVVVLAHQRHFLSAMPPHQRILRTGRTNEG